ncbi:MAG TPA: hypothetical protein VEV84_14980 [Pyrinomonadaceae bacterium]|nr:hypothetical protein [Pyrinomonadaceae bacterium]
MGIFGKLFRSHRTDKQRRKAIDLEFEHKYAEAAQAYAERAKLDLPDNELIFADDCIDSFKNWIKARNSEEALNEARRALQGYLLGDWLSEEKDDDNENLKSLQEMVSDLRAAGFLKESDAFLNDINNALRSLGLKPISILVISEENHFPPECPHCGGTITYRGSLDTINCPFCGGVIDKL